MKSDRVFPVRAGFFLRWGILGGVLALLGLCVLVDGANSAAERRWMWISAGGCFALAFGFAITIALQFGRTLTLGADGIRLGGRAKIDWAEVSEIDLSVWEERGLARVRFKAEGVRKTIAIEQSRYLDAAEIVRQLLERCGSARIVRNTSRGDSEIAVSGSAEAVPHTARKTVF